MSRVLVGLVLISMLSACAAFKKTENFAAISLKPNTPEYYAFIAQIYYQRREYRRSIVYHEELIRRFSKRAEVYDTDLAWAEYEIGFCHYKLNEFEEAYIRYQKVVTQYEDLGAVTLAGQRIRALEERFPGLLGLRGS